MSSDWKNTSFHLSYRTVLNSKGAFCSRKMANNSTLLPVREDYSEVYVPHCVRFPGTSTTIRKYRNVKSTIEVFNGWCNYMYRH